MASVLLLTCYISYLTLSGKKNLRANRGPKIVTSANWAPLNLTAEEQGENLLINQYTPPLANSAGPNAGCYINEANPLEPDLPDVFWGPNYPCLFAIKTAVDPDDAFWCFTCVGREGWIGVGDKLCKV
jgi:hypothetical protein